MLRFKRDRCYGAIAKFCLKLLPAIILLFALNNVYAQADTSTRQADTALTVRTDGNVPPLSLDPIPEQNTCSGYYSLQVFGGTPPYHFSSSDVSVAVVGQTTGQLQIKNAGTSQITAYDSQNLHDTKTLSVLQGASPTVTIAQSKPVFCGTEAAVFMATPGMGLSDCVYTWAHVIFKTGHTDTYNSTSNPVFTIGSLVTGDQIYCKMTSASGCVITAPIQSNIVTVIDLPYSTLNVGITQSPEGTIVSGTPITFTALPMLMPPYDPAEYTYQWLKNNIDIPNATSQTYTSTCSLNNDKYTCMVAPVIATAPCVTQPSVTSPVKQVTIINSGQEITASITASTNNVYAGTVINFKATLSDNANAVAYQWQINGVDTSDVTPELSTYLLRNNDVVTCVIFTDNGCQQVVISDPIKMVIYPSPVIVIPNTFTPNGDNFNDTWDIKYMELYHYNTVKIYNRYGALLFESKGYQIPWDGRFKGAVVPSGTYYYVIDLQNHQPVIGGAVNVIK